MGCRVERSESRGEMIVLGMSPNEGSCGVMMAEWGGVFLSGVILSLTIGNSY